MERKQRKKNLISAQKRSLENSLRKSSKEAEEIVDYWIRLSRKSKKMVTHSMDSKRILKMLFWIDRYRLNTTREHYQSFKVMKLKRSIKIFKKLLDANIIEGKFSISDFLRGKAVYLKDERKIVYKDPYYFKIIHNRKKLKKYLARRGNPEWYRTATKRLQELYKLLVLDEKRVRFSPKQKDQFELAGRRLIRYMIGNNKLDYLNYKEGANLDDFIRVLISALRWHYRQKGFGIGHLCSNYTFTEILPKYINFHRPR